MPAPRQRSIQAWRAVKTSRAGRARDLITAAVLIAALAHGSTARAALVPPLRSNPGSLPADVRRTFDESKRAYDGKEFARAGRGFGQALGKVADTPANRSMRAFLCVDAMLAYQEAFQASGDAAFLRTGLDIYYAYFKSYRDVHGSTNIPEVVVEQRFVMKDALARADANAKRGGTNGGTANGGTADGGTADGGTTSDPQPIAEDGGRDEQRDERERNRGPADTDPADKSTPMIISGAVLLALGASASSMIAIGAIGGKRAREDRKVPGYTPEQLDRIDSQGRKMNGLFIAGLVATPLLLAGGAVLLGKGVSDRRKAHLSFAPSVTPRFAGVVLRGRF